MKLFRETLAVLLGLAAFAGLWMMFSSEIGIVAIADLSQFQEKVLPSLQQYSLGIGLTLLLASIAIMLIGYEDDVDTTREDAESK